LVGGAREAGGMLETRAGESPPNRKRPDVTTTSRAAATAPLARSVRQKPWGPGA